MRVKDIHVQRNREIYSQFKLVIIQTMTQNHFANEAFGSLKGINQLILMLKVSMQSHCDLAQSYHKLDNYTELQVPFIFYSKET